MTSFIKIKILINSSVPFSVLGLAKVFNGIMVTISKASYNPIIKSNESF